MATISRELRKNDLGGLKMMTMGHNIRPFSFYKYELRRFSKYCMVAVSPGDKIRAYIFASVIGEGAETHCRIDQLHFMDPVSAEKLVREVEKLYFKTHNPNYLRVDVPSSNSNFMALFKQIGYECFKEYLDYNRGKKTVLKKLLSRISVQDETVAAYAKTSTTSVRDFVGTDMVELLKLRMQLVVQNTRPLDWQLQGIKHYPDFTLVAVNTKEIVGYATARVSGEGVEKYCQLLDLRYVLSLDIVERLLEEMEERADKIGNVSEMRILPNAKYENFFEQIGFTGSVGNDCNKDMRIKKVSRNRSAAAGDQSGAPVLEAKCVPEKRTSTASQKQMPKKEIHPVPKSKQIWTQKESMLTAGGSQQIDTDPSEEQRPVTDLDATDEPRMEELPRNTTTKAEDKPGAAMPGRNVSKPAVPCSNRYAELMKEELREERSGPFDGIEGTATADSASGTQRHNTSYTAKSRRARKQNKVESGTSGTQQQKVKSPYTVYGKWLVLCLLIGVFFFLWWF